MEFEIDIREIFFVIRKNLAALSFIVLVALVGSLLYLKFSAESYVATVTFSLQKAVAQNNFYNYDGYYSNLALEQDVSTLVAWGQSPSVISEISRTAGLASPETSSTFKTIKTGLKTIDLTITGENKDEVLALSSAAIKVFKKHIAELSTSQSEKLEITAFEPSISKKEVNKWLILVLGLGFGFILAFIYFCAKIYLSKKILFTIEARKICGKDEIFSVDSQNLSEDELRKLRFILANRTSSILFCPLSSGQQSSTKFCLSFAKNIARLKEKVILAEISARGGRLANLFAVRSAPGLVDLIENKKGDSELLVQTSEPNLVLLPAGLPTYDIDLLMRSNLSLLLRDLVKDFQFAIYFTGPLSNAENLKVLELGQPILLVELGQTNRKDLQQVVKAFQQNRVEFNFLLLTS